MFSPTGSRAPACPFFSFPFQVSFPLVLRVAVRDFSAPVVQFKAVATVSPSWFRGGATTRPGYTKCESSFPFTYLVVQIWRSSCSTFGSCTMSVFFSSYEFPDGCASG